MTPQISQPLFIANNDRMAAFTAFRTPTPLINNSQQVTSNMVLGAQAAHALPTQAAPKPTQLNDSQAGEALEQVQHQAQDVLNAHNGIDPERVARLLSLLD